MVVGGGVCSPLPINSLWHLWQADSWGAMAQVSQMGKKSKPISTTCFVHEPELSEQPALSEPQLQSSWRNSPHSTVDPFSRCRQAYSCRDFRAVKIPKIGRYHRKKESGWASCLLEEGHLVMVCLSAGSIVFTVNAREKCPHHCGP